MENEKVDVVDHLCSAFLRRVLQRMKELGLNKSMLAKRMNVSRPYINALLTRDCNFTFQTAAKLARALQMDFAPELSLTPQDGNAYAPAPIT